MAGRIFAMRSGSIVEEGTHEGLMSYGTLYRELFTLQASGYDVSREADSRVRSVP